MKVIEWNCQGAFRMKNERILEKKPDLIVVPECENESKLRFGKLTPTPDDFLWFGDDENKGLGVFSYGDHKFSVHHDYNPEFKIIVPITVTNAESEFLLFAIWANNREDPKARYVEQVWKAIHYYHQLITDNHIMILGDLNSSVAFDKKHRNGNHTDLVKALGDFGIRSLYHDFFKEVQGKESQPTFFMQRNIDKPYHIDYCFTSKQISTRLKHFQVGLYENWKDKSDHMPMLLNFAT
jgi:exonuclease III